MHAQHGSAYKYNCKFFYLDMYFTAAIGKIVFTCVQNVVSELE